MFVVLRDRRLLPSANDRRAKREKKSEILTISRGQSRGKMTIIDRFGVRRKAANFNTHGGETIAENLGRIAVFAADA